MNFNWKDQTIETLGNLFDAAAALSSVDEGQDFMRQYCAYLRRENVDNPESTAFANIGYLARYGDDETNDRIRSYTGAQHPIFG